MKVHTFNIERENLDKIKACKKLVELRSGSKYLKVSPGDKILFRLSGKDKPECSATVMHDERYQTFNQFRALNDDESDRTAFIIMCAGFSTWDNMEGALIEFYGSALYKQPFAVIHLGEVESLSCPGDGVIEQIKN